MTLKQLSNQQNVIFKNTPAFELLNESSSSLENSFNKKQIRIPARSSTLIAKNKSKKQNLFLTEKSVKKISKGIWTAEEDEKLLELV